MTTVLLVHGAWHGAWCWDRFAGHLRDGGLDVQAVALRDHPPAGPARLRHRIRDYVDDVRAVAARLDSAPVLVGHSMGGLVVQKYVQRHPALGAALLATVPTRGALGATLRFAARHPLVFAKANAVRRLGPIVGTPALAREMLFTPSTPASIVDETVGRLQDESYYAYLDMILSLPRPSRVTVPVLVLAGGADRIFTVREQRVTARAYGTTAEVFDGMGHNLMVEPGWERVADRVGAFARDLVAEATAA